MSEAAVAFTVIGPEVHREIVRLLLQRAARRGLAAAAIAERLTGRQTSVSGQLNGLAQAKIITPERRGRQIVHRVSVDALDALGQFLVPKKTDHAAS
jgi:DNA-binding transcriptional ArsR family regulator